ncbi:cathepsin K-like isoform X1 [Channa argus]|uniref:cathepsin K-like isoform X1 n=2 Tax=Channa argus TaxID=215402 RepID=UPI00352261BC
MIPGRLNLWKSSVLAGLGRMLLRVCVILLVTSGLSFCLDETCLDDQWEQWKITYRRNYNQNQHKTKEEKIYCSSLQQIENEEEHRRTIWKDNMRMIDIHNQEAEQGKHSYKLTMNHLGDMTPEEMAQMTIPTNHAKINPYIDETVHNQETTVKFPEQCMSRFNCMSSEKNNITGSLPKSIDYREKGLVTEVKNQEGCSCCWAFSAAGALEGQLAKKTGRLLDLSPQNLVDCVPGNNNCNGGHMTNAFKYVQENGGINSEKDYPYVGQKQHCSYNAAAKTAECKGFEEIPEGNELALAAALSEVGPLSVAINAKGLQFQFYGQGIYYNPECNEDRLNHAMLLVGYGETPEGKKYWIVKNSHGVLWGQQGYIWIARNRENHCGIASDASYPLM